MANRKLIRSSLREVKDQGSTRPSNGQGRRIPPEATGAEQFYYLKQMSGRTPMVVKLLDGEEITGVIEWYDKSCIKVNREDAPNLLVPKHVIKYMHKDESAASSK